ncbi:MAG: hypothetical protein GY796_34750 [Chloroflexi bacterium]|nr:hypothetical protein [Chloroflexota bacterium]
MTDLRTQIFTLAKVLIATAWADGQITEEEQNCLKDLLFHLPDAGLDAGIQMTSKEWARLEMYMETPIDAEERMRLVSDLQTVISKSEDKQLAINYLKQLASADGELSLEEQHIINEIENALNGSHTSLIETFNQFLGGVLGRRSKAVTQAPNRETYFAEFVKNKVYYEVKLQLEREGRSLDLSDEAMRKLGLAGGLMARVAHVDRDVTAAEKKKITAVIAQYWDIAQETAVFVADVALSSLDVSYDYYRMTREFGLSTTREERLKFLNVLFQIGLADGYVTFDEIEEIRQVARGINLTHEDFINAKLKIPRDKRD